MTPRRIVSRLCTALSLAAWLAPGSSIAAEARGPASQPERVLKLTFLGTGAPRPSAERYGASILVEAAGKQILIDCGPGARERIFQAGNFRLLTGITDIFVTHLHYDHIADIPDLWIAGWMYGRKVPLNVYGPTGTVTFVEHVRKAFAWDIRYREIVGIPAAGNALASKDVRPGVVYDDEDGVKITAFRVAHMPIDPTTGRVGNLAGDTLGYRVDYAGRSAVFSGDLRALPGSELIEHGKNADVLVLEVQVPAPGNSPEAVRANVSLSVHTSPQQAGYVFAQTRPRMAVYSHIIPPQTSSDDLRRATRPYYDGPLTTAFDLMTLTIGSQIEIGRQEPRTDEVFERSQVIK